MDGCIRNGVTSLETHLPGGLHVRRRAPGLYRRLQRGFYPTVELSPESDLLHPNPSRSGGPGVIGPDGKELVPKHGASTGGDGIGAGAGAGGLQRKKRIGRLDHPVRIVPRRTTPVFPGIEYLSCMAIAVSRIRKAISFFIHPCPSLSHVLGHIRLVIVLAQFSHRSMKSMRPAEGSLLPRKYSIA